MGLDFTLETYQELCETIIKSNYIPLTIEKYLTANKAGKFIILRHDVDRKPERALKMAQIEKNHGISSTYYFRMTKKVFQPDIIKKIANMGHEIGYHYEVLDKANGDIDKAIKIFEKELKEFRELVDIKTVCMHGNAFTKWINRDIWQKYNLRTFDLIGEPYLSIDHNEVLYLNDTSRTWDPKKYVLVDFVKIKNQFRERIKKTDDIIELIKSDKIKQIYISAHPQRWSDGFVEWVKELIGQNVKNVGKAILVKRAPRSR